MRQNAENAERAEVDGEPGGDGGRPHAGDPVDPRDHLGLVYKAAFRLARVLGCDPEELIGDSYIAMTAAARTWKAEKGCAFSTHATTALKYRLYGAEMKARGRVRVRENGDRWADALGLRFQGESFERVHGRRDEEDGPQARDIEARQRLGDAIARAEAVMPGRGGEVIRLMARGLSQRQVGRSLGVSRSYINNVFNRLLEGLRGEAERSAAGQAAQSTAQEVAR